MHLARTHFASDEKVTATVNKLLWKAMTKWYDEGMKKLVARLEKCIDQNGDDIKK